MKIVTIGELLIDLTQSGVNNGIPVYCANPGGAPANVSVAASLMGCETAFIGKVGNDSFGELLVDTLKNKGVNTDSVIKSDEYKTTLAVVSVEADGERSFSFYRKNCADVNLTVDEIDEDIIKSADIFHFGSVSLTDEPCAGAVEYAVKAAKESGAIITYDPNYRPLLWDDENEAVAKMRHLLKSVDIIKVSEEELYLISGCNDFDEGVNALLDEGIGIVIVTMGEKGACFKSNYTQGHVPALTGKVADTNGAGDTFFGAFLSLVTDLDNFEKNINNCLYDAVNFACKAAGLSVRKSGAIPSMPTKSQVEKLH